MKTKTLKTANRVLIPASNNILHIHQEIRDMYPNAVDVCYHGADGYFKPAKFRHVVTLKNGKKFVQLSQAV